MNIEENSNSLAIGRVGLSQNKSILQELADLMSKRLRSKKEDTADFFKEEMEKYETYYVADSEYFEPSNPSNSNHVPMINQIRIMTVALVEIADFGDWTYKHKSIVEENKILLKRVVTGYKSKNKAIIIRCIVTDKEYEGHGYASHLLKWIAESYHGDALYVYMMMRDSSIPMNDDEKDTLITSGEEEKALKFFTNCSFSDTENKKPITLSVVDTDKNTQEPIMDKNNKVYRTTTSKLKNISQKYLYGTAKFGKLDKCFVSKICYTNVITNDNYTDYLMNFSEIVYDHEEKKALEEVDNVKIVSDHDPSKMPITESESPDKTHQDPGKKSLEIKPSSSEKADSTEAIKINVTGSNVGEEEKNLPEGTQKEAKGTKTITKDKSKPETEKNQSLPKNPYKKQKKSGKKTEKKTDNDSKVEDKDKKDTPKKDEGTKTSPKMKKKTPKNPYRKPDRNMAFYGLNPHFGWLKFDSDLLTTVDASIMDAVRENPHRIVKIPGGYRDVVERKEVSLDNINLLPRIKHAFHLTSRSKQEIGTCQWVAAAMLIDVKDRSESNKMMNYMKHHPKKVNWKPMYKGDDSLSTLLTKVTRYHLKKVGKNTKNYIPYLMETKEGMYVCVLTDNNYAEKHVVGIDCGTDPKLIWDSSEKQALVLNQENLDRCTGLNNYCLKIQTIGRIVPQDSKKGKKRPYPDSESEK